MMQQIEKRDVSERERFIYMSLFLLIVFTLPFSIGPNSIATILFAIFSIWLLFKFQTFDKRFLIFFVANFLISIISLIGLINTTAFPPAMRFFETRMPLVIFPLLLLTTGRVWNKEMINKVLVSFALVTILCGLIIQGELVWELLKENKSLSYFFYWRNSNEVLADRIGIHPTYLSMYVIFSIGIIYELFIWNTKFTIKTILAYLFIAYLAILALHLSSRISLVTLGIVMIIIIINTFRQYKSRSLLIILPLIAGAIILFNLEIFAMKDRYMHPINNPFDKPSPGSVDDRAIAWHSSFNIIQEHCWFGVGTGDAEAELDKQYIQLEFGSLAGLNCHNQFFDSLIRNGIPGLLALLLLYFYGICDTRFNTRLYAMFIIVIVTTSLTENILDSQKGSVFWGFFNALLYRYSKAEREGLSG